MVCEYCGKTFETQKGPGRKPKYCSSECCRAADRENKRINYVGKREETCRLCGKELPKFKTRFCSNECRVRYDCIKTGQTITQTVIRRICPICGTEFETWKTQKVTCSLKCSQKRQNTKKADPEKTRIKYLRKHPNAKTKEQIKEGAEQRKKQQAIDREKRLIEEKQRKKDREKKALVKQKKKDYWLNYNQIHICNFCGEAFQASYPLVEYCSKKCQRKAAKFRRKEPDADRGLSLERLALRDGNICQICGKPVNWDDFTIKDGVTICGNEYPSIDHIYPRSKGGQLKWDNVQLAHRICNSTKRDIV